MEACSCFCLLAAAAGTIAVAWWLRGLARGLAGGLVAVLALVYLMNDEVPLCWGVVLFCCSFIVACMARTGEERLQAGGRAVLVTGCDSGFGHALAQRLCDEGVTVFAGVLDVNGVGAERLRERGSENLHVLQLDVTDDSQIEAVHRYVCTQVKDTGLWGLVNNAGVLQCPTSAELQPFSWYRLCMDVNFLSAVRMCQKFLPLLRRSRGRIVNMTSMTGLVPMPTMASYGSSKAALSMFSKVLRMEMCEWGVHVALIQPTGFRTSIYGDLNDTTRYSDQILESLSPEAREDYGTAYISSLPQYLSRMSQQSSGDLTPVVDAMLHALLSARPRRLYSPGRMALLLPLLYYYCPATVLEAFISTFTWTAERPPTGLELRGEGQGRRSRSSS